MQKLYDLHIKKRKIFQDDETFMFGIDAVLLSDFASSSIHKNDEVLDLGCGRWNHSDSFGGNKQGEKNRRI